MWSAAEDLGMAAIAHVGFARERIQFGWANNGANDLSTYTLLNMAVTSQIGPQLLLGALALDGVLERHPKLTVVVEEVGISWLPPLLGMLDHVVGRKDHSLLADGEFRPDFAGPAYKLPLKPSEYLQRQVTVTPLVVNEALRPVLDRSPAGDAVFLERLSARGGYCVGRCHLRAPTGGCSPHVRETFYGGVAARIGL